MAAGVLYESLSFDGIPSRSSLASATGTVELVDEYKYGVRFKLHDSPRLFNYLSKGNAMGLVSDALAREDRPTISVLYDPNSPGGPFYSNNTYYPVYEISVDEAVVRSHADVAAAWASDTTVVLWLSGMFFSIGVFLSFIASRNAT